MRWERGASVWLGAALMVTGVGFIAKTEWFVWHSRLVGAHLVRQEERRLQRPLANASAPTAPPLQPMTVVLGPTPLAPGQMLGLLQIPQLHLVAPVAQGTGEETLNMAVGHLLTSVAPGAVGTTVLAAHNATWFQNIDQLAPGAIFRYQSAQGTQEYQVTSHSVVRSGSVVDNTTYPSMVLETCYPLNALYYTPYRYLVFARLVRTTVGANLSAPSSAAPLKLGVPPGINVSSLSISDHAAPMGTLTIAGTPSNSWRQSNAPLEASNDAVALYFAVLQTAAAKRLDWWQALAPGLSPRAVSALWGRRVASYAKPLDVTVTVSGTVVKRLQLQTAVTLAKAPNSASRITLAASNRRGTVVLTAWDMSPMGQTSRGAG